MAKVRRSTTSRKGASGGGKMTTKRLGHQIFNQTEVRHNYAGN